MATRFYWNAAIYESEIPAYIIESIIKRRRQGSFINGNFVPVPQLEEYKTKTFWKLESIDNSKIRVSNPKWERNSRLTIETFKIRKIANLPETEIFIAKYLNLDTSNLLEVKNHDFNFVEGMKDIYLYLSKIDKKDYKKFTSSEKSKFDSLISSTRKFVTPYNPSGYYYPSGQTSRGTIEVLKTIDLTPDRLVKKSSKMANYYVNSKERFELARSYWTFFYEFRGIPRETGFDKFMAKLTIAGAVTIALFVTGGTIAAITGAAAPAALTGGSLATGALSGATGIDPTKLSNPSSAISSGIQSGVTNTLKDAQNSVVDSIKDAANNPQNLIDAGLKSIVKKPDSNKGAAQVKNDSVIPIESTSKLKSAAPTSNFAIAGIGLIVISAIIFRKGN